MGKKKDGHPQKFMKKVTSNKWGGRRERGAQEKKSISYDSKKGSGSKRRKGWKSGGRGEEEAG